MATKGETSAAGERQEWNARHGGRRPRMKRRARRGGGGGSNPLFIWAVLLLLVGIVALGNAISNRPQRARPAPIAGFPLPTAEPLPAGLPTEEEIAAKVRNLGGTDGKWTVITREPNDVSGAGVIENDLGWWKDLTGYEVTLGSATLTIEHASMRIRTGFDVSKFSHADVERNGNVYTLYVGAVKMHEYSITNVGVVHVVGNGWVFEPTDDQKQQLRTKVEQSLRFEKAGVACDVGILDETLRLAADPQVGLPSIVGQPGIVVKVEGYTNGCW